MKVFASLIVFFIASTTLVLAQSGSIQGVIKDAKTQEAIIGANVVLQGGNAGASTDYTGKFSIPNVAPGTYTVVVSYVAYKPKNQTVEVLAGKPSNVNLSLEEDAAELAAVEIVGVRQTNTDMALIREIKQAQVVVSGISAEQITKSQDSDAADVVKRVPGVTVMGDRFIVIRGLMARYNNVMLHNAFAPSMETDIKSFAFDIIPSAQLDRVLIFKSPSAELPGDFAGGVVKVFTKSIPSENRLTVGYSTAYRHGTSLRRFLGPERTNLHWTGFNDGSHDLPSWFPRDIRAVSNNPAALEQAGRALPNNWVPESRNAGLDQGVSISNDLRWDLNGMQIGNVTALTHSNSRAFFDVQRNEYNTFDFVNSQSRPIYDYQDAQYNQKISTGLLHNWSVRINPNHMVEFKNLFNQVGTYQYVNRTGTNIESNYDPDSHSFQQTFRGLYSGQLMGKHEFEEIKTSVDWVTGYNTSYQDMPDYRRYRSDVKAPDELSSATLYLPFGQAQSFFLGRFYSEMRESSYMGAFNASHALAFRNKPDFNPVLKVGVFMDQKERSFSARNIGYVRGASNFNSSLQEGSITNLFQPENINNQNGIRIDEQTNPSDSYTASNAHLAYYGSVTLPISKKLTLVTGVRVEDNTQKLNSARSTGEPTPVNQHIVNVLPSANLSFNFTEKMLVRAAYGKSLNRPEFRELAPFGFYDFEFNMVKLGNPNLVPAQIDNVDLRWELYPSADEVVSVGVFGKRFRNAIETKFIPGGGSGGIKSFSFQNAELAQSVGVEVEVKKSLAGLYDSNFFNDLGVLFNASLIYSQVKLGPQAVRDSDNRLMQGQSPYIINTGLYYNNVKSNTQVTLMYNVIGPRIFILGFDTNSSDAYMDIYEMPRNVLDLTVTKAIGKHFTLKAGISDILNQEVLLLQDANQDGKLDRHRDQAIQRYRPGTVYNTGISYTF